MNSFFKSGLRGLVTGICFMLGVGSILLVNAATIPLTCGPAGGQPSGCTTLNQPQLQGDLNNLINTLNGLFQYITLNNSGGEAGELQFTNAASFVSNGSVATSITSVGPQGSSTTIRKWLVVLDNNKVQYFVPMF